MRAYNSASPELMAIVDWTLDNDLRTELPNSMTPPLVDFLVVWQPAQSLSA